MPCVSNFKFVSAIATQNVFSTSAFCCSIPTQIAGTTWLNENATDANTFPSISAGGGSSFAIKTDGTLWLWGLNSAGHLATNTTADRSSPVQTISGGTNWKQISELAAIKTNGTLWLWGPGYSGRHGNNNTNSRSSPVQTIAGGTTWNQVSSCSNLSGAIKTDGTLWMWGSNFTGALGNNLGYGNDRSSPVQTIAGGTTWKILGVGTNAAAAIKTDGTLWVWGAGIGGRLGNNGSTNQSSPVQTVAGGTNWKQVSSSAFTTAAVKTDGTLWIWGCNATGQLGINSTVDQSSPVQTISGGTNWKQTDINNCSSGAVKADGTLWLWGQNACGRLGDCTFTNKSSPIQTVVGGTSWSQVRLGCQGTIATKSDCTLFAWGGNSFGQAAGDTCVNLGCVKTFADFDDVFVRKEFFNDGGLWVSGRFSCGARGTNGVYSATDISSPVQTVVGGTNWKNISTGRCSPGIVDTTAVSTGIKTDGTLWLWGSQIAGRLGNNTSSSYLSSAVQTVAGGNNWKTVSSGPAVAAIKTDGTLWLWGLNTLGNLGDSSVVSKSSPVQTIAGGSNWISVCAYNAVGAIKTDGTLWMWGGSGLQLGNGTSSSRSSPVQTVAGGTNWKQVSVGVTGVGAIKTDGTLWTWGCNSQGSLGINFDPATVTARSSPVQTVAGGTNWKQVSVGTCVMLAVKCDGTLWTWGEGVRLGTNSSTHQSSPVQTIAGGSNWKSTFAGACSVSAIKTDGTLWGWGSNGTGNLGDNTNIAKSSPVQTVAGGTNWINASEGGFVFFGIREGCW